MLVNPNGISLTGSDRRRTSVYRFHTTPCSPHIDFASFLPARCERQDSRAARRQAEVGLRLGRGLWNEVSTTRPTRSDQPILGERDRGTSWLNIHFALVAASKQTTRVRAPLPAADDS